MSEASAATPAPDPPRTQEDLTAAQNVLLDRLAVLLEDNAALARKAGAAAVSPEIAGALDRGWHRVADVQGELRELRAEGRKTLARRSLARAWEIVQPEPAPAPVPEPRRSRRRGGHRRYNPDQPPLWGLPSLVPVAAAAFRPVAAMVRHSGHAVTAGTAATVIGGGVLLASVVPNSAATFGLGGGSAATPAPAASIWSAVPAPVGDPGRIASAVTHPGARTLTLLAPPTLPAYDPPAPDGGSQVPAPQLPSQVPAPQVSLIVTGALDLGLNSTGQIRVTAFGGPVSWQASASAAGMNLDVASGSLAAGHSTSIGISLTADLQALAGPGSVTITYGGGRSAVVPVSWTVVPLPVPLPVDVPSAAASVLPSLPVTLP